MSTHLSLLALASGLIAFDAFGQAGTWTPLPFNTVTGNPNKIVVLLTDGTLLAQSDVDWHVWSQLTPDPTGSYVNGTWSPGGTSQIGRLYFPFWVLRDGRVFIAGGEDLSANETDSNAAEVYDPILHTWFRPADSPLGGIGDAPSQELTDGRIFLGSGMQTQVFDPSTFQWTITASKPSSSSQESWELLPGGDVLDFTPITPFKYIPSLNQWITDTSPPGLPLQDPGNSEIGPGVFLYTGRLLAFGGLGNTALYLPPASATAPGSWTAGPNLPPPSSPNMNPNGTQYAEDVPACIEPNDKVLLLSSDMPLGGGNTDFNEYDPVANTITPIPPPPIPLRAAFFYHLLALPTGQILLTGTGTNEYVYTPVGGPQNSWRPQIRSIAANPDFSYTLTGTQLNGLSGGASYGDEGDGHTNYPLVRFVSGTTVRYARTFNHSTMDFATGSTPVQTHFVLPDNLPPGTYSVSVVANGIESPAVSLTVPDSKVSATISFSSVWETGYCANVILTNTRSVPISSWTVTFLLGNATFNANWNMVPSQTGGTLTASNASFNGSLPPGGQAQFGFCAQSPYPMPPSGPMISFARGS